jgi:amidase
VSRMGTAKPLAGVVLAVPRMFIGKDPDQGTGIGIGTIIGSRIEPRPSVVALFDRARADLEAAGAELIETDFPVITNYEGDRAGAPNLMSRGLVTKEFLDREIWDLSMWAWDTFLALNGQPGLTSLVQVDGPNIFPRHPDDLLDELASDIDVDLAEYVTRAREKGIDDPFSGPLADIIRDGLLALEKTREMDFDRWLEENACDGAVFPTLVDVGPADAHANPTSAKLAKRNGVGVATGNLAIRHLGIPTVTVPMGIAEDISMPFGVTFAGPAYSDQKLVGLASLFEALGNRRVPPPRTP